MLDYENSLFEKGFTTIAGADEVGRGAFAGPVVVSAVAETQVKNLNLKVQNCPVIVKDSKQMTSIQREKSAIWIKKNFLYGIGEASNLEINKFGIIKATHLAYRRAISVIHQSLIINHLLLDAFYVPYLKNISKTNQTPIIKGDSKSFLIASASIIAKVYRDALMSDLAKKSEYKHYLWHKNKGYGTKAHREAIKKYGKCDLHRDLFIHQTLRKDLE